MTSRNNCNNNMSLLLRTIEQSSPDIIVNILHQHIPDLARIMDSSLLQTIIWYISDDKISQNLIESDVDILEKKNYSGEITIYISGTSKSLMTKLSVYKSTYFDGSSTLSVRKTTKIITFAEIIDTLLIYEKNLVVNSELICNAVRIQQFDIIVHFLQLYPHMNSSCRKDAMVYILLQYRRKYLDDFLSILSQNKLELCINDNYQLVQTSCEAKFPYSHLLESVADLTVNNEQAFGNYNNTVLHFSCMKEQTHLISLLIKYDAAINAVNKNGETPLDIAIKYSCWDNAKVLLMNQPKICDSHLLDAAKNLQITIVELLLEQGANPNVCDFNKRTALHLSASGSDDDDPFTDDTIRAAIAEILLKKGAQVDARTKYGVTPFMAAVRYSYNNVAEVLIKYGAALYESMVRTLLFMATHRYNAKIVDMLLQKYPYPDLKDSFGKTPFHVAYKLRHKLLIRTFLKHNADYSLVYDSGMNLFHIAAKEGFLDIIEDLINKNFNVNSTDNRGRTALHFATENANIQIVELLLGHGADINLCAEGQPPLYYAFDNVFREPSSFDQDRSDPELERDMSNYEWHDDYVEQCLYPYIERIIDEIIQLFKKRIIKMIETNCFVSEKNLDPEPRDDYYTRKRPIETYKQCPLKHRQLLDELDGENDYRPFIIFLSLPKKCRDNILSYLNDQDIAAMIEAHSKPSLFFKYKEAKRFHF